MKHQNENYRMSKIVLFEKRNDFHFHEDHMVSFLNYYFKNINK